MTPQAGVRACVLMTKVRKITVFENELLLFVTSWSQLVDHFWVISGPGEFGLN